MTDYRCEATTVAGFVQQLSVAYVTHGYWWYVTGDVPERKDPAAVDRTLVEKYAIHLSRWTRYRRKSLGLANVHYLRYGRFFVLVATMGKHRFYEVEGPRVLDIRRVPIKFHGHSIGFRQCRGGGSWHSSVRIEEGEYRNLKAYFCAVARRRSAEELAAELGRLRFEPYAPIRSQLLSVLRAVNRERFAGGLEPVPASALRFRRSPVLPFAWPDPSPCLVCVGECRCG
ncbi:MAG: hypothetical protein U0746_10535 [Gemmataceae bacterium]